jgi:hypothetical protein
VPADRFVFESFRRGGERARSTAALTTPTAVAVVITFVLPSPMACLLNLAPVAGV